MEYTALGRTGLKVSVIGMGCGGPSRIGQNYKKSVSESVRVVREAIDSGINIIDTAECYETEGIVGEALKNVAREDVVISTKKNSWGEEYPLSEDAIVGALHNSLKLLGTDYVDIYHLHGLPSDIYPRAREEAVPILHRLRDQGKIRFLGVTEAFHGDSDHRMLRKAVADDCWDVIMVGFNILNQTARKTIFPAAIDKGIGTLIMFAVRKAFSCPQRLVEIVDDLKKRGKITGDLLDLLDDDPNDPLGFLTRSNGVESLADAAYRFCRHEPGADVILSGTGNVDHLHENIASLLKPDISPEHRTRLEQIFAKVDDVSGG